MVEASKTLFAHIWSLSIRQPRGGKKRQLEITGWSSTGKLVEDVNLGVG